MLKLYISLISIFISLSNICRADDIVLPHAMAALGDSLTEGMLSDFSIERPPNIRQLLSIIRASTFEDRIPYFRKYYARPNHSWSAGNDESDIVFSHYEHLKKYLPDLRVHNYAISGSESSALNEQVDQLLMDERDQGISYDYVTLMIGANDMRREKIEDFVSPLVYQQNIESNLRKILEEDSDRRILLVSLPPVHEVFERSSAFKAYSLLGRGVNCHDMRIAVYGELVVFKPELGDDYRASKVIFSIYMQSLQTIAERLQAEFPRATLKAISNVQSQRTSKKNLSIDCFHPSDWGQAELAETTWKFGFWPQLK